MTLAQGDRSRPPEMWGGIECTVNRVGDRYFDQADWNGHARRPDDLDRIAALGVRALRYPVLWERVRPDGGAGDWARADERLGRLRRLGVRPIVGLVHHGSGPRHTALTEHSFADGLADFARRVAERYPWVDDYTPVNEPLTTARFSGMYGVWYPHGRDARTFLLCLLNQCRAVVLAMRAIRDVRPDARLVQTDDLGKTYATPALAYQADFENERRWLTYDLLMGRVDNSHPIRGFFRYVGVPDADVDWFLDNPCPPDVFGFNHYLTSERYLDDRTDRYPASFHGGNGRHAYADVEAVRVLTEGIAGTAGLLREAWQRYRRPLAVTEAHLGCTREEQMRWLLEVWRAACELRAEGVDVRAVTAWSLLGAHEWDTLVTRPHGHYEPGAFDVRGPSPRPTALARLIRDLATGREPAHPALAAPGWWRRPHRLLYETAAGPDSTPAPEGRPLLIVGAEGGLARAVVRACEIRGLAHRLLNRRTSDALGPDLAAALAEFDPWAVVYAGGAEGDLPALAAACARRGAGLLAFSSGPYRGRLRVKSDPIKFLYVHGPSEAPAVIHGGLDLLIDGESGDWRVGEQGAARREGESLPAVRPRGPAWHWIGSGEGARIGRKKVVAADEGVYNTLSLRIGRPPQ